MAYDISTLKNEIRRAGHVGMRGSTPLTSGLGIVAWGFESPFSTE